jgi:hypothetical protein
MIESQGERAGDVLKEFVAVNQSEEDIETRALWADDDQRRRVSDCALAGPRP